MTNKTWATNPSIYADAPFKSWGGGISTALSDCGFIKTSDTGQINWTSVVKPSTGSNAGYEIWRFNDALQATTPIFFKITYGISNGASNYPRMVWELGGGSDGAGNISPVYGIITISNAGTNPVSDAKNSYMASDGSGVCFAHIIDSLTPEIRHLIVIDRFRNSDGSPNNKGFMFLAKQGPNNDVNVLINNRASTPTSAVWVNKSPSLIPMDLGPTSSALVGDTVYFSPYYIILTSGATGVQHIKMLLSYPLADFGYNSDQTITFLGADRTYKTLGTYMGRMDSRNQVYASAAMWWGD